MADLSTVRVIALTDEAAAPADGQYILVDSSDGTAKMELVKILQNEAPEFDATAAYSAGAYVLHDGALYQFTADHAAGAWAGTDAEVVTIGAELAAINTDIASVQTALETKAEIDGYYEEMTVGDAEQLVATQYVEDAEPYLFRTSGGTADIGNREYDKIVGGSLAWNQLVQNGNFENGTSGWESASGTLSVNDGILTFASTVQSATAAINANVLGTINGHKYYACIDIKFNDTLPNQNIFIGSGGHQGILKSVTELNKWVTVSGVFARSTGGNDKFSIYPRAGTWGEGDTIDIKNCMCIDLTQMFGSTIADYIYSLETGTAGAGVAWFRKLFPLDYYEYNAGELKHVSGLTSHDTVGFNAYNPETGTAKLLGGNQYQISGTYTSVSYEDINGDSETLTIDSDGLFTPTNNGTLTVAGGTSTDTCVHLVWSGYRNGEYEAYVKHSYPLDSDLILRGVPKLDASNNLYYDGDTYEADGTVTRKYGVRAYEDGDTSDGSTMMTDGTNTIYLLATPTTETADSFQSPQICDDFGTEEYVLASGTFPVPVGHSTKYPPNLRDKLQHLPSLADDDGTYLITQADRQMTLTQYTAPTGLPDAPTTDGTYVLKATVASGAVTYTWEVES